MEISYESAATQDIETIFQCNKELINQYENLKNIQYEKVLQWVRRKIMENIKEYTRVIVDKETVGYVHFYPNCGKMEIDDLYVLPEYRNKGIGTEIIRECISKTNKPIFLYVFSGNVGAVSLYESMGFKIIEKINDSRYIMERR